MNTESRLKNSRVRFSCLLGLLLLLIMTRYALQIDIPRFLFLIVIGVLVLLGDRDEIAAMSICCIPMHESIDFFYALVICVCVYLIKYFRTVRIGTGVLLVFVVLIWELLHCFRETFSVVSFLSSIIPFGVLAVLMASDAEELDYPFIVRAFAWATLGTSLMLIIKVLYFSGFSIELAFAGLQRLGSDMHSNIQEVTVAGGQVNPNTLGIITVLAATGLMQLRSMKVSRKNDMVLLCALLVLAALGTSRTYLVCLALMILLLIFSEKGGAKKKLQLVFVLLAATAVVIAAVAVCFPETFAYFVSRFLEADITTGRGDLMAQYHRFIVTNPKVMFWGIGLQDFGERLLHYYRAGANAPHNSIQEIIVAWGIPGLVLLSLLLLGLYDAASRRNRNMSLLNWIPLIIILFKSLAGQLLSSPYTMLALSFAYLSLRTDMTPCTKDVFDPNQERILWVREKNKICLRRKTRK